MKLYRVVCKGMIVSHGSAYVVATDPTMAYLKLRDYLDKKDLGFRVDRELDRIILIADESEYPDCGEKLFL